MNQEMEFKNIVAQYSKVAPEEMNNDQVVKDNQVDRIRDYV